MKHIIAHERMAILLEKHRRLISSSPELSILGARDGQDLLDLHRTHEAKLLVLDTEMPGLTPFEICRQVRVHPVLRQVSLIVIGGAADVETLSTCMANRSFVRPLRREDFLGAVRTLFDVAARKDYRVLMSLQLKGVVKGTPFFGQSENISATGILFTSKRILDAGDIADLMFVLPGQGQLHTAIDIVRVEAMPGKEHMYGARFVDPTAQTFHMLDTFIRQRLR